MVCYGGGYLIARVPMAENQSSNPYLTPGQAPAKVEAPGARTARICGIAAIVCALTCVGIPIALILGIVALVKASKAKALARSYPETYEMPSAAGMILGIVGLCLPVVMLPFAGIVSAIAVPALLGQRQRARDHVQEAQWTLVRIQAMALPVVQGTPGDHPLTGEEAIQRLMGDPNLRALKNIQAPGEPVLIRSTEPRPGTIALSPLQEETADRLIWSVVLRASFGPTNVPNVREEKIEVGSRLRALLPGMVGEPSPSN